MSRGAPWRTHWLGTDPGPSPATHHGEQGQSTERWHTGIGAGRPVHRRRFEGTLAGYGPAAPGQPWARLPRAQGGPRHARGQMPAAAPPRGHAGPCRGQLVSPCRRTGQDKARTYFGDLGLERTWLVARYTASKTVESRESGGRSEEPGGMGKGLKGADDRRRTTIQRREDTCSG
jgi:hypothetical protein